MAFPSSPTVGDIYSDNGFSWRWDGVAWSSYGSLQNALQRYNLTLNTNLQETNIATNSATTIDSFNKSTYSTAEYTIQMKQGSQYRSSKLFVLNDGTNVSSTEYAILNSGSAQIPATITSAISGSNVVVSAIVTTAGATSVAVKAYRLAVTG
jgi:hypothetical protein